MELVHKMSNIFFSLRQHSAADREIKPPIRYKIAILFTCCINYYFLISTTDDDYHGPVDSGGLNNAV
jgi:hypothetical protein